MTRAANIARVICNHRHLLLPGVRIHGLASEILRTAAQRMADDWDARYAVRQVAACTVRVLALKSGWRKVLPCRPPPGQGAGRRV